MRILMRKMTVECAMSTPLEVDLHKVELREVEFPKFRVTIENLLFTTWTIRDILPSTHRPSAVQPAVAFNLMAVNLPGLT